MLARYDAVDDPLVGLLLRLAAHPHAAFIFTMFLFALWNLSQYNYALFAGFVFQPVPRSNQKYFEVVCAVMLQTSLLIPGLLPLYRRL